MALPAVQAMNSVIGCKLRCPKQFDTQLFRSTNLATNPASPEKRSAKPNSMPAVFAHNKHSVPGIKMARLAKRMIAHRFGQTDSLVQFLTARTGFGHQPPRQTKFSQSVSTPRLSSTRQHAHKPGSKSPRSTN